MLISVVVSAILNCTKRYDYQGSNTKLRDVFSWLKSLKLGEWEKKQKVIY